MLRTPDTRPIFQGSGPHAAEQKAWQLMRPPPLLSLSPTVQVSKNLDEWTEDEQKAAKEFEKKKQQLQEDREKYRKSLETELKKLQSGIGDATAAFDEKLGQLFQRKVKTEMVIYQVSANSCVVLFLFCYVAFAEGAPSQNAKVFFIFGGVFGIPIPITYRPNTGVKSLGFS